MVIRIIKKYLILFFSFLLLGCPNVENIGCVPEFTASIDNLVSLSPLKNIYNVGDLVIFKAVVPSTNTFFGSEINMKEKTDLNTALLSTNFPFLYSENNFTFIKGSKFEEYNYNMQYISSSNTFELEIIIELTKPGSYIIYNTNLLYGGNTPKFSLGNGERCTIFFIGTNIEGIDKTQPYQITVQ